MYGSLAVIVTRHTVRSDDENDNFNIPCCFVKNGVFTKYFPHHVSCISYNYCVIKIIFFIDLLKNFLFLQPHLWVLQEKLKDYQEF